MEEGCPFGTAGVDYGYNGFDMSKTHSQEERNKEIDIHNKKFISQYKDKFFNIEFILKEFNCWKGICYLGDKAHPIAEFPAWTSEEIINWLIKFDNDLFKENKEITEESKKQVGRIITKEKRYSILKRQGWVCNECGTKLKFSKNSTWDGEVAHIDHIFPYSKKKDYVNGEENINEITNLQALCPRCNQIKRNKNVN